MTDNPVTDVTAVTANSPGARVLDAIEEFIQRFIAYPSTAAVIAHTLWIVHCHLANEFDNTPRLAALSPEPGSGKSRLLEVTEPLVPNAVINVNASAAYVFRKIGENQDSPPTLLFDEVDAIFNGKGDRTEELRGLLNSGYRRGATAGRAAVHGKEIVTEDWPSFAPVAMAGLNALPDTLMTRSIVIRMRRRKPTEFVLPYRQRVYKAEAAELFASIAAWASTVREQVRDSWPELPEGIEDRAADVWEPIIAVADAAGGVWPQRAREAATALVDEAKERPVTLGIRLLTDIRTVLGADTRISTHELLDRLISLETAPWASLKGEPIDSRVLARMLNKYDIPTGNTIRLNGTIVKGYELRHFDDAFARYVAPVTKIQGYSGYTSNADQIEGVS